MTNISKEQEITTQLKKLFTKRDVYTTKDLAVELGLPVREARQLIKDRIALGHTYTIQGTMVIYSNLIPKSVHKINLDSMAAGTYKIGATGDNHLCSRYERMDVLNALYDVFEKEGITQVFNTGNWIDGEARFNKHDLLVHGMDNQIDYFVKNYPQREGITTSYITGDDHEGWYTQREGVDIGKYAEYKAIAAGRNDLKYLGHMEADVEIKAPNGKTTIRVLHPGGGSSYAISYTSQKIVESYTEAEVPDILFNGHYHKSSYNFIRGVHVVQTGCTEDQTPFMRKKRLAAHIGGWIIEFTVDTNGKVIRFKQEWISFQDKGYYKKWAYQW